MVLFHLIKQSSEDDVKLLRILSLQPFKWYKATCTYICM